MQMTRFILDSGNPQEYRILSQQFSEKGHELWGGTTNPTLIAKKLSGKKVTPQEAFELQKEIIYEIIELVPGAVSAEVYADLSTNAEEMIEQGREIASWHDRVVVKLPTTLEGFKARTVLRKENIITNNTLVFSQEQIYAICLHEHLVNNKGREGKWPPFISPFVGRLDDTGENGLSLVEHGMTLKKQFEEPLWMLEASVRSSYHLQEGIRIGTELITAPAATYTTWLSGQIEKSRQNNLAVPTLWKPSDALSSIDSVESLLEKIESNELNINHPLTEKGLIRFAEDWQTILQQ